MVDRKKERNGYMNSLQCIIMIRYRGFPIFHPREKKSSFSQRFIALPNFFSIVVKITLLTTTMSFSYINI